MRIAVISDVHSNIVALDSVLNDINSKRVDTIVCTGDIVGYLPYPKEVIGRIRDKNILVIKGNHDDKVARSEFISKEEFEALTPEDIQKSASLLYTCYVIDEDEKDYLKGLPKTLVLEFKSIRLRFVHGSPKNIAEYMYEDFELLKSFVNQFEEEVIISGHTHIPYNKMIGGKQFINAGSVGKPKHGNANSLYLIIDTDCEIMVESNSTKKNNEQSDARPHVDVNFVEVAYDIEEMCRAIDENPYIATQLTDALKEGR